MDGSTPGTEGALELPPNDAPTSASESVRPAMDTTVDVYVKRNLTRSLVSLLTIVAVLVFASAVFRDSMMAATEWIYESIGIGGLLALLFVTDALITPIPPDAILVVIANSPLRDQADWLIVGIGALSAVAGNVGWWIGSSLGNTPWVSKRLERSRRKHHRLLTRYGGWAVALGAVTPVPFSVTCWSAGALGVPLRIVAPMTLLRFPRFVLFYVAIAYAGDFGTWLTH